ncbi:proteasome assembly chaperone 4 [Neophocaena asiaeorientalis asiaeorientalis]|uniref:Proteasome assembly chaperone 4 n=1 Tax=Neophocaena asiaeorientalis asiaeorientalis TaxID=1706337 RepID=A0A341AVF6_NEOAA|nr:proteasome assembly chaperone 4 [Neophocaena asiaeorientalis asiaeorientalis]
MAGWAPSASAHVWKAASRFLLQRESPGLGLTFSPPLPPASAPWALHDQLEPSRTSLENSSAPGLSPVSLPSSRLARARGGGGFECLRHRLNSAALCWAARLHPDPIPVSTALLGDMSDTTSTGLAQRLARKTSKQVFVSYNLPNTDSSFTLLVENRIKEEMEAFPEKF